MAEAKLRQQTDVIYAETEAKKVVIDSQAQATKRMQEGYTYQQERGYDVAEKVAQNESVGQFTNMGLGLGTMFGVGGAVGGMVGGVVKDAIDEVSPKENSSESDKANEADDMTVFKAKIEKLKLMKDSDLISEEEFNDMKAKLLGDIL